ncbi:MAG: transglutaminase-like domain-containing protein [Candidatus Micrarchaeota archaeon]
MLKNAFAVLLLAGLLVSCASPNPKEVAAARVFLELNWTVDFGESVPNEFSFSTFAYPSNAWQSVRFESRGIPLQEERDSLGNVIAKFSFAPRSRVEALSLRALADVNYSARQPAGEGGVDYLLQAGLTQATPEMSATAASVTSRARSDLAKAVALAEWVHNRVSYDGFGYGNSVLSAAWVFENNAGTCDEYSHLFAALARSLGIPTKFVAGFVCSGDCDEPSNWGAHAWNEVLANGSWVPVDSTFNEAVVLDATHVKFAEGFDQNDVKERLSTSGGYKVSGVNLSRSLYASLDEWRGFSGLVGLSVSFADGVFGEGAVVRVKLNASNQAGFPIAVPLSVVAPGEIRVSPKSDALVLLQPGESVSREWSVLLPSSLDAGYQYNFTVRGVSLGAVADAFIIARKDGAAGVGSKLELVEVRPMVDGGRLKLVVTLQNSGGEVVEGMVGVESNAGNFSEPFYLSAGESRQVVFAFPSSGSVSGNIALSFGAKRLVQPFVVTVQEAPAEIAPLGMGDYYLVGGLAMGIVITLITALYLIRNR